MPKKRKADKTKKPKVVVDFSLSKVRSVNDLVLQLGAAGGFSSKKVAVGTEILTDMVKEKKCVTFLSFPGNIISTGTRGVIKDLVKHKLVDVIITTCGTLDHDLARVWKDYFHGEFLTGFTDDLTIFYNFPFDSQLITSLQFQEF